MASTLVDQQSFRLFSRVDISTYDDLYMAGLFGTAHAICARYLKYDPAVQVHLNEQGDVGPPIKTGRDAFQISFRTKHRPFISQSATTGPSAVFTALLLLFPAPFPNTDLFQQAGALSTIVVRQNTGRVYMPYLGMGGLPGIAFQYGYGGIPTMSATGYIASYTAGYAITTADAAAYPSALTVPLEMQKAAAWIAEVLMGQGELLSADIRSAASGIITSYKNMDYSERYHEPELDTIGRAIMTGTHQGRLAQAELDGYAKTSAGKVMLL